LFKSVVFVHPSSEQKQILILIAFKKTVEKLKNHKNEKKGFVA